MRTNIFSTAALTRATALALAAAVSACTLDRQTAPSEIGPSGHALSLSMTASPNMLRRDGVSRSVVTLTARGVQGEPLSDQRFLLELIPGAGSLSVGDVVTGASGQAQVEFIAPENDVNVNEVVVRATPYTGEYGDTNGMIVRIGLFGPALPTPSFTFSPASFSRLEPVTFDASGTTVDGLPCGAACIYRWEFNDEATLEGQVVEYAFENDGFYNVALTVYSLKHNTQQKVVKRIKVGLD